MGADQAIFVKFGIEVGKEGYQQLERTLPEGFPSPGGTVTYRYRRSEGDQNTLYQLGHGVFTANGLEPYTSWEEFRPVIKRGLDALWRLQPLPVSSPVWLVLRYVDVFKRHHLGEMTSPDFFRLIVGVNYDRPAAASAFPETASQEVMRFFSTRKDEEGRELAIDVGNGIHANEDAIVMNTVANSAAIEEPSVDDVLAQFDILQKSSHDVFFEMVARDGDFFSRLQG